MKPGRAGTMTHDYKRHGTTDLFAALNLATGEVLYDTSIAVGSVSGFEVVFCSCGWLRAVDSGAVAAWAVGAGRVAGAGGGGGVG